MSQRDLLEKQEEWADTIEVKPKIKTNIKMRVTPEQSKKVQDVCRFNNKLLSRYISKLDTDHFLYIFDNRIGYDFLAHEDNYVNFFSHLKEVDADLFIKTNGTCIEKPKEIEHQPNLIDELSKLTGLSKEEIRLKGVDMFKEREPIIEDRMNQFIEDVNNGNNPFLDFDKFIEEKNNKEDYKNAHYKTQKIDTVARCKANMTLEQQKAICIFSIDKYTHREKGQNLEDIQKVRYYLDWLEEIENKLKDK